MAPTCTAEVLRKKQEQRVVDANAMKDLLEDDAVAAALLPMLPEGYRSPRGRQMNDAILHMSDQGGGVVPRAQLPGVLFTTGLKRAVMCSDGL